MFAASKTDSVSGGPPDGQFNYVTMLLHGDGTNGAQNNTFLDSSTNNFTITRNGNTTQGSFSPYGSNWSNYFPSSSYLEIANNTALQMSTGDFTIEFWLNFSSLSNYQTIFTKGYNNAGGLLVQTDTGTGKLLVYVAGSVVITASSASTLGTWNHYALVRNSGTLTLYLNGTSVGSVSNSTNFNNTESFNVGGSVSGYYTNGYISNFRVVKGTAVYTGSFTPSTTPLTAITNTQLLVCQSNRFVDNSANAFLSTITGTPSVQRFNPFGTSTAYSTSVIGGSGYFDKASDYLDGPTNSAFAFGTGDFTLSAWVYIFNGTSAQIIWTNQTTSSASAPNLGFFILNNKVCINNTNTSHSESTGTIANNSWNYVGVTKSSGTYTFYINGSASGTTSSIGTNDFTENACRIGYGNYGSGFYFGGYITDLRVIKGSAVTPSVPTSPVGTVTNTQLLLNMTNGAIIDNAMMNNLETVGNAQISTSVKKYGTGSLYFDGTGDYLVCPASATSRFAGSFTVEFWLYFNSIPSNYINLFQGLTTSTQIFITTKANGQGLRFGLSGVAEYAAATKTWSTGTWYHVALVRNGTNVRFYVDGTNVSDGTYTDSTTYSGVMGIGGTFAGQADLNGYIDDLRISNGFARYTANFTPPTAAFSDTGPY